MSSQYEDSATYVYVINNNHGLTEGATVNVNSLTVAGSGGFFHQATQLLEEDTAITANAGKFFFAKLNADSTLVKSPVFRGTTISNATSADALDVLINQVTYWGYNGTAGAMDSAAGYYGLKIVLDHTFGMFNNSPLIKTIPFKSTTATQNNLARGLALSADRAFSQDVNRDVIVEAICNEGVTAGNAFDQIATVVNGATTISIATSSLYGGVQLVAGDFIRIGTVAGGTALTDPVYLVTDVDIAAPDIVTVDRPIRAASGAYAPGSADMEVITAAEGLAADWGLQFTGNTPAAFNPVTDTPFVVSFAVESDDFSTATVTNDTAPFIGTGTSDLVGFDEAYAQFQTRGKHASACPPAPALTFQRTAGSAYNSVVFEASDSEFTSATTGLNPTSKFRIKIYYLDATADTDLANTLNILGATAITLP